MFDPVAVNQKYSWNYGATNCAATSPGTNFLPDNPRRIALILSVPGASTALTIAPGPITSISFAWRQTSAMQALKLSYAEFGGLLGAPWFARSEAGTTIMQWCEVLYDADK